eukprot:4346504-Prymnesium_polylepis.1
MEGWRERGAMGARCLLALEACKGDAHAHGTREQQNGDGGHTPLDTRHLPRGVTWGSRAGHVEGTWWARSTRKQCD